MKSHTKIVLKVVGKSRCAHDFHTPLWVVGSRDRSLVVSLGIFSIATDGTMCPGVDSASKNEYQDTPAGKDGRCVRVTTYHLHSAESYENPRP